MEFDFSKCTVKELLEHFDLIEEHVLNYIDKGQFGSAGQMLLHFRKLFKELAGRIE